MPITTGSSPKALTGLGSAKKPKKPRVPKLKAGKGKGKERKPETTLDKMLKGKV